MSSGRADGDSGGERDSPGAAVEQARSGGGPEGGESAEGSHPGEGAEPAGSSEPVESAEPLESADLSNAEPADDVENVEAAEDGVAVAPPVIPLSALNVKAQKWFLASAFGVLALHLLLVSLVALIIRYLMHTFAPGYRELWPLWLCLTLLALLALVAAVLNWWRSPLKYVALLGLTLFAGGAVAMEAGHSGTWTTSLLACSYATFVYLATSVCVLCKRNDFSGNWLFLTSGLLLFLAVFFTIPGLTYRDIPYDVWEQLWVHLGVSLFIFYASLETQRFLGVWGQESKFGVEDQVGVVLTYWCDPFNFPIYLCRMMCGG